MNSNNHAEKIKDFKKRINDKRIEWKMIRTERLNKKEELLRLGVEIQKVRKNVFCKKLKKDQARLSKDIKHLEQKLNKKLK